ncbi:MAG: spore coat protein CotH [Myxococcales bacterium]|nr:spore coat protein CotH [Myxococcales bacterium]
MNRLALAWALLAFGCGACHPERPPGWSEATHGPDAAPDYALLFDDSKVRRLDIRIAPEVHRAMLEDLEKYKQAPEGPLSAGDPMWVPVELEFEGGVWRHVGMRYKGNSSLKSAVAEGIRKLAFRLDFDKFEDDYPSIRDQRFYGFGEMTFSNAFKDPSLIRDKLAADIFRRGGVPAARGAFVRVHVDFGEGPVYFGLYTMIEDPADRMLSSQFNTGGGNLYKPEPMQGPDSGGATWSRFVEADFDKQTNQGSGYADVIAAIAALNAPAPDPAAWRAGLEAVFDVAGFLRWLAINQTMENWDSYLCIPHNYYLYADPGDGGRLSWIPWDLNEAMLHRAGHCNPETLAWSVLLDEVDQRRPLVRRLLDDPVYRQRYRDELVAAISGAFEPDWVQQTARAYHELVAPFVTGTEGEAAPYTFLKDDAEFETSLDGPGGTPLNLHVQARVSFVRQALGL